MANITSLIIGLCMGFIPSLIWLVFWLREDPHPESAKSIIKAFIGGMLSVPGAILFQYISMRIAGGESMASFDIESLVGPMLFIMIFVWATIEEIVKLLCVSQSSLYSSDDDERIDPVIFLLTSALGFAAVENTLFILEPIFNNEWLLAATVIDMRFIGATLLHVLCSGVIGLAIGYAFYMPLAKKIYYIFGGVVLASVLHTLFNLFIIRNVLPTMQIFGILWVLIIAFIYLIEKLKKIPREDLVPAETQVGSEIK